MNEKQLIKKCRKGNRKAQKLMVDKYSELLYSICCRYTGDRIFAQDCLQESWVQIFWNLDKYKEQGLWTSWISMVTINKCKELLRKHNRWKTDELQEYDKSDEENIEYEIVQYEELEALLNLLPVRYRMVVNMYYVEGFSHSEIAEMLEINESSSRAILSRALSKLRSAVENQNIKESEFQLKKNFNSKLAI